MSKVQTTIKIILSILFFLCLAKMPYGYYQFVRFIALTGFAILAYNANEKGNKMEAIIFVALALLFQPFIKIAFGREIWNIIDVVVRYNLFFLACCKVPNYLFFFLSYFSKVLYICVLVVQHAHRIYAISIGGAESLTLKCLRKIPPILTA